MEFVSFSTRNYFSELYRSVVQALGQGPLIWGTGFIRHDGMIQFSNLSYTDALYRPLEYLAASVLAQTQARVQQAYTDYLNVKQETNEIVRQACAAYYRSVNDGFAQPCGWSVFWGWYYDDFMPLIADRKMLEDVCASPTIWMEQRDASLTAWMEQRDTSLIEKRITPSIASFPLELSCNYFYFPFFFDPTSFSTYCCQQDLRCQRRLRRHLTMQKTLDKQKSMIDGTTGRIWFFPLSIFRISDVGRQGASTAGWLDRQKRCASHSNTGSSLILWIGRAKEAELDLSNLNHH